jgi:hypothetical protein
MIRNATLEDVHKLVALKSTVGRDTYLHYGTPSQFDKWVDEVCSPNYFEGLLNNSTTILVAEYGSEFLGMASVSFYGDRAFFGNLYVGLQDRGIGSLLTQHRFNLVKQNVSLLGYGQTYDVEVRCFYQNHRAYNHLLKHGFTPFDWTMHEQYGFPVVIMHRTFENDTVTYT